MSLDEENLNPPAPGELPGRNPDQPSKGKKRRKSKAKKVEEDVDSADNSAVLALSEAARKPKKMLFESDEDSSSVSLSPLIARNDESTRAALSTTAAVVPAAPTPVAVAPAVPVPDESLHDQPEPQAAAAPSAEPELPVVDVTDSDVQASPTVGESDVDPAQGILDLDAPTLAEAWQAVAEPEADVTETTISLPAETSMGTASSETETDFAPAAEPPASVEPVDDDITVAAMPAPSISPPVLDAAPEIVSTFDEIAHPAAAEIRPTPVQPVSVAASEPEPPAPVAEAETPSRDRGTAGLSRSEMIARAARMSALSSARPNNGSSAAAAPTPRPSAPPQQQQPMELPRHAGDLYGYWTRVKNGRRFPSRADFDVEQMAENFPNSMLLTCGTNGSSHVNFSSILRLGANRRTLPGETLSFTSMITEWILAIGGEAVRAGTPVQDTEVFPSPEGTFAYKIVALPLSDQQTRVDHVLCHLSRS